MQVLAGQWVVGSTWLDESSRLGYWADESAHEIKGDHTSLDEHTGQAAGGPRAGRLRAERSDPRLFEGLTFSLQVPHARARARAHTHFLAQTR